MSSIYKDWQGLRDETAGLLAKKDRPEDVSALLGDRLGSLQQRAMAEETDSAARQMLGVLFADARHSLRLLCWEPEAKIWTSGERKNASPAVFVILALLLGALLAVMLSYGLKQEDKWVAVGAGCALLMLLVLSLAGLGLRRRPSAAEQETMVLLHIPPAAALGYMDELCSRLDRHRDEIAYLLEQRGSGGDGLEPDILRLCQTALQAEREGDMELMSGCAGYVHAYLSAKGLEAADYSQDVRGGFDLLPAKSGCTTVRPALRRIKNGSVVLRGVAAVGDSEAAYTAMSGEAKG